MRNFMLDSNIIGEKTEKGYSTTNSIIEGLKKLEEICEAAYEEINSHDELENVDYISVTKDVQYLDEYKMKYQKFGGTLSGYTGEGGTKLIPNSYGGYANTNTYSGYMGYNTYGGDTQTEGIMSEYKSEADYKFYSAKESLLERLSNTNLEDIRVDNNLGVTLKSPSSIFTPGIQTETSLAKDKIGIEDLLSFGVISKDLKKQYDENKELIEKYNESLDDYNPDNYPDAIPEFLTKAWYNLTKEKEESIDNFDDYAKAIITQGDFNFETTNEKALSLGLDFVPIVGEGKLGLEALLGEDLVTGKKLNGLERILSMIPAGSTGVSKIIEKATVKDVDVAAEATIEKGTSVTFGMNGGGQLDDLLNRINKGEKVETEIAEVSKGVSEADFLKSKILQMNSFQEDISSILKNEKITLDEFNSMRMKGASELTDEQRRIMMKIREQVPTPNSDTTLQKVIDGGKIDNYIKDDNPWNTVGGFITKAQDTKELSTLQEVYDGLALGYEKTPFTVGVDKDYGIIRFKTDAVDKIDIPYGPTMERVGAKPPTDGFDTSPDPFTGHGFTKDINGNIIPEYTMQYLKPNEGSELYRVNSETGIEELIAKYVDGKFVKIK